MILRLLVNVFNQLCSMSSKLWDSRREAFGGRPKINFCECGAGNLTLPIDKCQGEKLVPFEYFGLSCFGCRDISSAMNSSEQMPVPVDKTRGGFAIVIGGHRIDRRPSCNPYKLENSMNRRSFVCSAGSALVEPIVFPSLFGKPALKKGTGSAA